MRAPCAAHLQPRQPESHPQSSSAPADGNPEDPREAIKNVKEIQEKWNVAAMLTETMACAAVKPANAAGMSWSYWQVVWDPQTTSLS